MCKPVYVNVFYDWHSYMLFRYLINTYAYFILLWVKSKNAAHQLGRRFFFILFNESSMCRIAFCLSIITLSNYHIITLVCYFVNSWHFHPFNFSGFGSGSSQRVNGVNARFTGWC